MLDVAPANLGHCLPLAPLPVLTLKLLYLLFAHTKNLSLVLAFLHHSLQAVFTSCVCVSDWQCQHYMSYHSCWKNGAKASTCHFLLCCTWRVMDNPDPIPCLRGNGMHMSASQYHQWYELDRYPELFMFIIFCQEGKYGHDSTPSIKQTIKMIKKRDSCITQMNVLRVPPTLALQNLNQAYHYLIALPWTGPFMSLTVSHYLTDEGVGQSDLNVPSCYDSVSLKHESSKESGWPSLDKPDPNWKKQP